MLTGKQEKIYEFEFHPKGIKAGGSNPISLSTQSDPFFDWIVRRLRLGTTFVPFLVPVQLAEVISFDSPLKPYLEYCVVGALTPYVPDLSAIEIYCERINKFMPENPFYGNTQPALMHLASEERILWELLAENMIGDRYFNPVTPVICVPKRWS